MNGIAEAVRQIRGTSVNPVEDVDLEPALHAEKGYQVTVICLSYGERGESAKLWRQPGMTMDRVKTSREAEAKKAAALLGVHDIQFWDLGDYPITPVVVTLGAIIIGIPLGLFVAVTLFLPRGIVGLVNQFDLRRMRHGPLKFLYAGKGT